MADYANDVLVATPWVEDQLEDPAVRESHPVRGRDQRLLRLRSRHASTIRPQVNLKSTVEHRSAYGRQPAAQTQRVTGDL